MEEIPSHQLEGAYTSLLRLAKLMGAVFVDQHVLHDGSERHSNDHSV